MQRFRLPCGTLGIRGRRGGGRTVGLQLRESLFSESAEGDEPRRRTVFNADFDFQGEGFVLLKPSMCGPLADFIRLLRVLFKKYRRNRGARRRRMGTEPHREALGSPLDNKGKTSSFSF